MFLWKGSPRARTQGVPSLLILIFLLALSGCGGGESIPDAQGSASILNASPSGFPLTVDIVGSGTVTSSSGGINCRGLGTPCNALYTGSASVTLLAAPAAEFDFQGWSGDGAGCGSNVSCTVAMSSARSVRATFSLKTYALTVGLSGSGTVTSAPAGINCGADCSEGYASGASVSLTAAPAAGFTFAGWSGSGVTCPGTGACSVSLTGARAVTATFSPIAASNFVLQVNLSGSGTVTSAPTGISCGADCSESYASGASVTLTAAPASGYTFSGWSGGGCSGTGACTVGMTIARTTTATFTPATFGLSVSVTGSGTVTSAPAGISCGADCSESYASGASVTLTAAPASGYTFSGWSGGGCSGTGTCIVSMTAARGVAAVFAQSTFALTLSVSGSGTVTSAPAGVNCGADCAENYASGTSVTLTATPASGNSFTGWGGACTGTGACTVAMTAARSVTAGFTANTAVATYTVSWDLVTDTRVTGYKLYYSAVPFSNGATPRTVDVGNVNTYVFDPAAVGIAAGTTVYFAVAATGGGSESALSDTVTAMMQ